MGYPRQINPSNYLLGQQTSSNPETVYTKKNASGVAIPFGIAMKITANGYDLPSAADQITSRMAVSKAATRAINASYDSNGNWVVGDSNSYPSLSATVGVTQGDFAVRVENDVQAGSPCFIRFANGSAGLTQKGAFRSDADVVSSSATAAVHPNWYFLEAGAAGSVVPVALK